eukprot:2229042-Alexandrium_andersonii.AAC.1
MGDREGVKGAAASLRNLLQRQLRAIVGLLGLLEGELDLGVDFLHPSVEEGQHLRRHLQVVVAQELHDDLNSVRVVRGLPEDVQVVELQELRP